MKIIFKVMGFLVENIAVKIAIVGIVLASWVYLGISYYDCTSHGGKYVKEVFGWYTCIEAK